MLQRCSTTIVISVFLAMCESAVTAERWTQDDAKQWTRYLVPLPRSITLSGAAKVPANRIAVVAEGEEPLVQQAVKELRECLGTTATKAQPLWTIRLVTGNGPWAEAVSTLRHHDQAYAIHAGKDGKTIELVGGGPRGTYYAAKTMQQLLKAYAKGGSVRVPFVTITDYPDMEDRGFWGANSFDHLRWMSDRKLNYDEQIAHNGIDASKQCKVNLSDSKQRILDEGPTYGINGVPVVLHLEQLSGSGLFDAYPELKGKNGRPGSICYSNPLFADILSQWLLLWRAKPGVKEVDVWMAENMQQEKGCQCEQCAKEDRSVLEARAIVAAWKKALVKDPALKIRILTSEETEKANPRIFAELPMDVKIWYYHSLFTYNAGHRPMLRPYLVEAIKQGHWLGVCPNICGIVGTYQPFTGPQFIHARLNEFVDKRLSGLIGYPVPTVGHCRFNAEAAAEWAWNAKGRSPREFAVSWAVREGLKDPEKFADWCDANGPAAWDVYGSEFPSGEQRKFPGQMADLLRTGKLPGMGEVLWEVYGIPFGDFKSAEQLDRDVQQAARAVQLANEMGVTEFIQESLVTQGYVQAIKALWELKQVVKDGRVNQGDKSSAQRGFKMYIDGLTQARAALPKWETSLPMGSGREHYTKGAVTVVDGMITSMTALAKDLGCEP